MEICHIVMLVSVTLIVLGALGLVVRSRKRPAELDVVEVDEEIGVTADDVP